MVNQYVLNEIQEANEVMLEQVTAFKVTDLESANWCFRKIAAFREEQNEINELAQAELDRINKWKNDRTNHINNTITFFESLLTDYMLQLKAEDPKAKINTPYGKIITRKQPKKWNYQNEEETIKYLTANGYNNLIRVKEELNKEELKKVLKVNGNAPVTEEGEIIPGIEIVDQEEKIVIEVG